MSNDSTTNDVERDVAFQDEASSQDEWLSLAQAAQRIGVAKSALYQWLQAGKVPHHRFGRLIRIHRDDLAEFIDSSRNTSWKSCSR